MPVKNTSAEERGGRRTGALLAAGTLVLLMLGAAAAFGYLWFARSPVTLAGYTIAGPNSTDAVLWPRSSLFTSRIYGVTGVPGTGQGNKNDVSRLAPLPADYAGSWMTVSPARPSVRLGPFTVYRP